MLTARPICSMIVFVCLLTISNCTTLIADVNFNVAWGPSPANNATNVHYKTPDGNSITLSWQPGDLAKQHDIYFGTSTGSLVYQGSRYDANSDPRNWTITGSFSMGYDYYWRIDETNDSNVLAQGQVWKFTTHDGRAYNPMPVNGATVLSEPLQLSWTSGDFTTVHRVFFGTNVTTVTNASTAATDGRYRGTVSSPVYPLTRLLETAAPAYVAWTIQAGTTYYWRIDEVNGSTTWKGPVWSFTPAAYVNIDDFEDYNSTNDVNVNWPDGYVITDGGFPVITGNARRGLVRDATGKYLRYTYNNSGTAPGGMAFSEARRPYIGGTTFTGGGVISPVLWALRIDYRGAATNAVDPVYDRMYVAIEDTTGNVAVYQNPDGNAALVDNWTSWYSSLTDINAAGDPLPVNLEAISGFAIGFGIRGNIWDFGGGDGNVMFDNIRLYTVSCGGNSSADFNGDDIVDWGDFDWIPEFWLVDYSSGYAPITAPIVDLYPDCVIDFKDFAVFANQWRTEGQ